MTSNAILAVRTIFSESWRLFTSWHIPGTSVSPASWLVFAVVFYIGIKMVMGILGMTAVFGTFDTSGAIKTYRQGGHSDRDLARYDAVINNSRLNMPEVGASGHIYYPKGNGKW